VGYWGGKPMRWFRIRKAEIAPDLRETFERYGTEGMQVVLALGGNVKHQNERIPVDEVMEPVLSWLTERYDTAERKETWSLTMEFVITIFVALEAVPIIYRIFCWVAAKL